MKLDKKHLIDASYHISVHLAKLLQSRRFVEIDQSETIIACGGHVPIKHGHHSKKSSPLKQLCQMN
jgi:hypothetical protein